MLAVAFLNSSVFTNLQSFWNCILQKHLLNMMNQKSGVWPWMVKNWQNVSEDNSSVYVTETTKLIALLIQQEFNSNLSEEDYEWICLFTTNFRDFMQYFRFGSIKKCKKNEKMQKVTNFQRLGHHITMKRNLIWSSDLIFILLANFGHYLSVYQHNWPKISKKLILLINPSKWTQNQQKFKIYSNISIWYIFEHLWAKNGKT